MFRVMESFLVARAAFAAALGKTFGGKRDVDTVLGYAGQLFPEDYRRRFDRGGIAWPLVCSFPTSTWRGTGELIEDETKTEYTPFEQAWKDLSTRLHIWPTFRRADILAGLGHYSVIFVGAPGRPSEPLPNDLTPDDIWYLSIYSEQETAIEAYEEDSQNPRFGLPKTYKLSRLGPKGSKGRQLATKVFADHSRILHIADGCLDDNVNGTPRLERVWNDLDNLVKVVGGGSEAFWLRAHQGTHINIDKDMKLKDREASVEKLKEQWEEFEHGMRRTLTTQGVGVNTLGSDVANFGPQAETILSLLAGTSGIPVRILVGSERGELASTQDQENWAERVKDRRREFAEPFVVRPFVDKLILCGALPTPVQYFTRWPDVFDLPEGERYALADKAAGINFKNGIEVVTVNEIRDEILGKGPIEKVKDAQVNKETTPKEEIPPVVEGALPLEDARAEARAATRASLLLEKKRA